jgi:hypothetical protein
VEETAVSFFFRCEKPQLLRMIKSIFEKQRKVDIRIVGVAIGVARTRSACELTGKHLKDDTYYRIYGFPPLPNGSTAPWGPRSPHFSRFHDHSLFRHTTLGRTPLDEGPARRRDLYLTTHNTHKRQTSIHPVGFEPTILVSKRPHTHALDRTNDHFTYRYTCSYVLISSVTH